MFGDIVTIFAAGLIAETNFADFPEFEKTIIALTSELYAISLTERRIDFTGSLLEIIEFLKSSMCSFLYFSVEINCLVHCKYSL